MAETIEAVYEHGIFRPLQPVRLDEGKRVHLVVHSEDALPTPDEMLQAARDVYEGLSKEQIADVEALALDRTRFITVR